MEPIGADHGSRRQLNSGSAAKMAVLMSSFGDEQSARQAQEAGAFAYLAKPFELDELLPLLEQAHGRALPLN